ncbi:hypothetical protein JCGZ_07127 [Jatropha curcas]|uniref:Transmembrane protein n=1 Tax=Jatropha curcas TaxID=180498 RepID=A0A067KBF8_JATCU|nr:uncharacterized protein LOC105637596 [Jatropha curcas]KDP33556.1 hypothetical protein JCGZ_07127 [Jatropha curcas]
MMLCHRLLSFSLLITFLFFFSSTLLPFSLGVSHFPALPPAERENEATYGVAFPWESRRSVVEAPISEPVESSASTLVLAPRRTYRKDPLNGFKRYTGGWNISDRHYWASVGFTAIPLFAIAAVWFLGFGLCLLLFCVCYFCCGRKSYGYSQSAYVLSLFFLIVFSIGAIIGCVILYTGQGKFHKSTTETLDYVVSQADATVQKLKDVSNYLASAKLTAVDKVYLPSNVQTDIDQIGTRINSSASTLADRTLENSDDIRDLLDSVRLALIVVAAIMLLLTFLGFLFSIFGIQVLVYILVIVGWIVVAGTFILCGTFLLLHNVAGDTCVAMNHWVQNPTSHTALDDILPCVDSATAQETLSRSKEVTLQYVDLINSVITNVSNLNFSPNFPQMYFNQSGPLVPILCNPFNHDLTDRPCSDGEVDLNNATQVWGSYVCQVSATGICITTGRLTPDIYNQMTAAVSVCNGLGNYAPFLVELEDCTFVRETFGEIYRNHCPSLNQYSRWVYVGLVMVSTAVMLSVIFWVIYGRERRHRAYNKKLQAESTQSLEEDKHSQS